MMVDLKDPQIQRTLLITAYARALGLRAALPTRGDVHFHLATDFNRVISTVSDQFDGIFSDLSVSEEFAYYVGRGGVGQILCCDATFLYSRVSQFIYFLEHIHHANSSIVEIGSLYNSIKDKELKDRVSDLLSAPGNFDRAINQATQVLEDRIRKVSGIDKQLTGPNLVNAVIKTDIEKGILRVSESDEEHEGVGHICRGLMLAFRNPTHHLISDAYSREDALKLCAFIDSMISIIEQSEMIKK